MKHRSIRTQLRYAVTHSIRYGVSRRVDKLNKVDVRKNSYSFRTVQKLLAVSNQLAKFLQSNYPELKWVKDLTSDHIQAFIDANAKNWSQQTVKTRKSDLRKLQVILNSTYFIHLDFSDVIYPEKKKEIVRDHPMTVEDFSILAERGLTKKSCIKFIPILTYILGTRTEEAGSIKPEDIDLEARRVHLTNCKGGRRRSIPIRREFLEVMTYIKNYFEVNNWKNAINSLKYTSIKAFYGRLKNELEIKEKYPNEDNHAIRKLYARRRFKEEYDRTKNKKLSWIIVQKELGHGDRIRGELFRAYIGYNYKNFDPENEEIEFMHDTYPTFSIENDTIVIKREIDGTI